LINLTIVILLYTHRFGGKTTRFRDIFLNVCEYFAAEAAAAAAKAKKKPNQQLIQSKAKHKQFADNNYLHEIYKYDI
jgi:hypothetical protein